MYMCTNQPELPGCAGVRPATEGAAPPALSVVIASLLLHALPEHFFFIVPGYHDAKMSFDKIFDLTAGVYFYF